MDVSIEFLSGQLKNKGIRPSYQRIKVLEYLYRQGGHPTVDEIFCALSAGIPSLSKVTVYNTLHILREAGLVQEVVIDESEKRYDITLTDHGHFQCEVCRTVYNFQVEINQAPIEGLAQFEVRQKNVYFKGLCPNCRKDAGGENEDMISAR